MRRPLGAGAAGRMSLDRDMDRLAAVEAFAAMPSEALRLMTFAAEKNRHADGALIFSAGEAAEGGLVVTAGTVELRRERPEGQESRLVGTGTLIGEQALVTATLRRSTAFARGSVTLLGISRDLFTRVLEEYPAVALALRRRWAERLGARLTRNPAE